MMQITPLCFLLRCFFFSLAFLLFLYSLLFLYFLLFFYLFLTEVNKSVFKILHHWNKYVPCVGDTYACLSRSSPSRLWASINGLKRGQRESSMSVKFFMASSWVISPKACQANLNTYKWQWTKKVCDSTFTGHNSFKVQSFNNIWETRSIAELVEF